MNDTISREAVADAINGIECTRHTTWYEFYQKVMTAVEKLPSAEPKRGKWIKKHRHYGGFKSYTGFDAMGEQHTVTVDERTEYDDLYCSECGARSADNFLNFCPNCGSYNRGETNDQ